MARVVEQVIAVKISRIVKDSSDLEQVANPEQVGSLIESIPQLVESILDDPAVVVEVVDLR